MKVMRWIAIGTLGFGAYKAWKNRQTRRMEPRIDRAA